MTTQPRYVASRGKLGSPLVQDVEAKRPVLVCLRDTEADGKVADEEAMTRARICAQALNRVHAEHAWKQQQGGRS